MKQLLPGIWQWSWFSEDKQLDFNGLFLNVGEHKILVDPPPMTAEAHTPVGSSSVIMSVRRRRTRPIFVANYRCLRPMSRRWM